MANYNWTYEMWGQLSYWSLVRYINLFWIPRWLLDPRTMALEQYIDAFSISLYSSARSNIYFINTSYSINEETDYWFIAILSIYSSFYLICLIYYNNSQSDSICLFSFYLKHILRKLLWPHFRRKALGLRV